MTHGCAFRAPRVARIAAALLAVPLALHAQFTRPPAPAAYALKGVTVVAADGTRSTGMTLVVRGDFIDAIGPGAAVPADAQLLEGDSLLVYPGIVDGWGSVSYEFPKEEVDRAKVRSWDPPRSLRGFMPHRRVVDYLKATGKDLADLRKKGVVEVAVQPADALMPGRGAVLLLRTDVSDPEALVLQPQLGPVFTLVGGKGVYPATLMGAIAWYRQTFLDASRRAQIADAAARDPHGVAPAAFDPDYAVVREAIDGGTTVYWLANSADDIRRVLRISDEFRLHPVIAGGAEAWKVADLLKARDIPVLVSLDFPKPKRWMPAAEKKKPAADSAGAKPPSADSAGTTPPADSAGTTPSADSAGAKPAAPDSAAAKTPEPPSPGALREKARLEDIYANAGRLAKAGVRFALTSGGGKADIVEGTRKAIEYGLSAEDALRALTATPAALYGTPATARVEAGLPATFVVTDGPLFEKGSRIVYTFVQGGLERAASGSKGGDGDASAATAQVGGTWSIEFSGAANALPGATLKLTQNGTELSGTMEIGGFGTFPASGKVTGENVTITVDVNAGGQSMSVELTGSVKGERANGTATAPTGNVDWTGRRTSGPGGDA